MRREEKKDGEAVVVSGAREIIDQELDFEGHCDIQSYCII